MRKLSDKDELDESAAFSADEDQDLVVIQMRSLIYAVCHATKEMHNIIQRVRLDDDSLHSLSRLIRSSTLLDENMKTWEEQTYKTHQYHHVNAAQLWPPESPLAVGAPTTIHVYSSVSVASMWNLYRTTRLYLLKSISRSSSRLAHEQGQDAYSPGHKESEATLQSQMQRLSNDVCASIPYMLGEVDEEKHVQQNRHNKAAGGMFLLWPLGSLLPLGVLPPEQVAWVGERLDYIRNGLGIQHWVRSVPTAQT